MILNGLPYPPTANTYYRSCRGRTFISSRGLKFRAEVARCIGDVEPLTGRLDVALVVCMPDKRKRDIDNLIKPTLDALTKAGVWLDDSQIDKLSIERGEMRNGGQLIVCIMPR